MGISVVLATYNGGRFIKQQLDSLASQSFLPAEIVVSDDCSTDETLSIVRDFAASAPVPVHVHRNAVRKGYQGNFIGAAGLCTAELIAFCDQDDVWDSEKLAEVEKAFADPAIVLVHHNARLIDADGRVIGSLRKAGAFPAVTGPLTVDPWELMLGFTLVFRRQLLQFSSLWDQAINFQAAAKPVGHDRWIFFLASVFGGIGYIDRPLVDYRQHSANVFGASGSDEQGIIRAVQRKLSIGGEVYGRLSAVCSNRAILLEKIASDGVPGADTSRQAAHAAVQYTELAEWLAVRARAYQESWLPVRFRHWFTLVAANAYRSANPWSFTTRSALRDLLLGVILGSVLNNDRAGARVR